MSNSFYKYQALGNDMIVIDPAFFAEPLTAEIARAVCDRHCGPGADGICYGPLSPTGDRLEMRFFNPDGTEAQKSGNGLCIFARYLWEAGYVSNRQFKIGMGKELVEANIKDDYARTISLELGQLSFLSTDLPMLGPRRFVINEPMSLAGHSFQITGVSISNPHCVIFSDASLTTLAQQHGPSIEKAPQFPQRTNVQFVQVIDQHAIRIEIWERGAGYTLASGTSASAAAGAAIRTGRCLSPVAVHMAGGMAHVTVDSNWRVTLFSSVRPVYQGLMADRWLDELKD